MRFRFPAWGVLVLLVAICAAAIGLMVLARSRPMPAAALLARLPGEDATVVSIDFKALRDSGLLKMLAGAGNLQEPEYRAFVEQTGFDYQADLDLALLSFSGDGVFYVLRGRFDWKSLSGYAIRQGGSCLNTLCRMPGSTPQRWISFFPLQQNVMALAVSPDPWAADRLHKRGAGLKDVPSEPVWALVSASSVRKANGLPAGVRLLAEPLGDAERIAITLGPRDNRIELVLDVTCRSAREAGSLAGRLSAVTAALREMTAKDKKPPEPGQLGTVLAAGAFSQQDRRVTGRWPLERKFLEALAEGE